MSLFQKSVVKKYLQGLDTVQVDTAWNKYASHFHNPTIQDHIRSSKEEEYQEGFVRDLFVTVLGYTLKPQPDYDFVLEKKTEADATKSDGALLHSSDVIGVVELKDTDVNNLDRIEQQAFGYKNKHKKCRYVITSNFEKIRFYINDAVDFEEFNLFTLTKDEFDLLFICLHRGSIEKDLPFRIKEESLVKEESVTVKLYSDYSVFKRKLFESVTSLNPQYNKLDLFKKTQKLLDRFLFILFAEDRMLLPPNSVRDVLSQWQQLKELDNYVPLFDRFKKYFGYLNTGYEGKQHEIFAYNGGLFASDEILDSIVIDDEVLIKGIMQLSNYDFESEIDVNILGHIFEHSLSQIEQIQSELSGKTIEKGHSKRKKDGIFYTPRYITKYIVENTVGTICSKKKKELKLIESDFSYRRRKDARENKLKILEKYRSWLLSLKICDPACGSGAFLNQALEFLIAEHRYIDELRANLFGEKLVMNDMETEILSNNLFGVDINEEAIEIARLSLWLRTAKKGRKLNDLSKNIKCGNSLIDDTRIGNAAFNWANEFPQVFSQGDKNKFDVVIGNPPYGASFGKEEKAIIRKYQTYKYKYESYIYFFERGIEILRTGGYLGYITPELWLNLESAEPLRSYIYEQSDLVQLNVVGENVFPDAVVNTVITILCKEKVRRAFKIINKAKESEWNYQDWKSSRLMAIEYRMSKEELAIVKKIEMNSVFLEEFGESIQGLTPYDKYTGQDPELIKARGYHFRYKKDETCGKWLNGEDLSRYSLVWSGEWLSYGDWLGAPREKRFFEGSRLLFREIPGKSKRIQATITEETSYYGHSITPFILYNREDIQLLQSILCLVNSKLLSWYGNLRLPNFGKEIFPKLNPQDIKMMPIFKDIADFKDILSEQASKMLSKTRELEGVSSEFVDHLKAKFESLKITSRMLSWTNMEFKELLKEFKKQKIKMTLTEELDWMKYFQEKKERASKLLSEIEMTDKEIDNIVFRLHQISDEERGVIN